MQESSMILGNGGGLVPEAGRRSPGADELSSGVRHDNVSDVAAVRCTFLDVLDILRKYSVPSVDLGRAVGTLIDGQGTEDASAEAAAAERALQRTARHYRHALGGGYSALVIRHTTTDDVTEVASVSDVLLRRNPRLVTESGTVVAIKKISPRPSANCASDTAATSEAFNTICQEIRVCRHPLLRTHENIGKLLYVAWEPLETFPWIALELAAYGTLEDILTAPGEGPTTKQKLNLTIDVALGLAVLHQAGVVHGDLKPANILIHDHPERQIVAQLSDFGGSAMLEDGSPSIGTPLWLAPEACAGCSTVDWRLADVWSFGLVVASIWYHRPHDWRIANACYLELRLPKQPHQYVKDARMLLLKTEPDSSPDSLLSLCAMDFMPMIAALLVPTLSSQNTRRKTMNMLVAQDLTSFFAAVNRRPVTVEGESCCDHEQANFDRLTINHSHNGLPEEHHFKVWSPGHRSRTKKYQQTVYHHLVEASTPLRNVMELSRNMLSVERSQVSGQDVAPQDGHYANALQTWRMYAAAAARLSYRHHIQYGRQPIVAFQVAVSHCCNVGVQLDDGEMVAWAYAAAKGGHHNALWMAPLLEESYSATYEDRNFHTACLIIGACIGSMPSLFILRREDQALYEATLAAITSRRRPSFANGGGALELFLQFLEAPRLELSHCNLIDALKSQNAGRARAILGLQSTDVSDMVDEAGCNVLHLLSFLEDKDTEGLALLAFADGADLCGTAALEELTTMFLLTVRLAGTPIAWAALKGMDCLFEQLLELHEKTQAIIKDAYTMAICIALLHHHKILRSLLSHFERNPDLLPRDHPLADRQEMLQTLLGTTLTTANTIPLSRRMLHGPLAQPAKLRTIECLLHAGAQAIALGCSGFTDFNEPSRGRNAVSLAIASDDDKSLEVLLTGLRAADEEEARRLMGGTRPLWWYARECVMEQALACLRTLLRMFPDTANPFAINADDLDTLTPLNFAARNSRPDYALALLEAGADPTIRHKHHSALTRALVDGHLDTAEVIYNFCSDEERQLTFGYHEVTGFSMSGRLMSTWRTSRKGEALVNAMKWLYDKNGALFQCEIGVDHPVWREILFARTSSSAEQAKLDNLMLEALFNMFPDKLEQPDEEGLYPIHRATLNGHRYALQLLLDSNVNINIESEGGPDTPMGLTPLSIAASRLRSRAPPDVRDGGRVEIRRWREVMKDIHDLLRSKNATFGDNPSTEDFYRSLQDKIPYFSVMTNHERDQDDEIEWGDDIWPKKLPKDESSTRNNRREGGELVTAQTKNALRQLLTPFISTMNTREVSQEDQDQFAAYKRWLLPVVEARVERYRQHMPEWDHISEERSDGPDHVSTAWKQWHSCHWDRRVNPLQRGSANEGPGEGHEDPQEESSTDEGKQAASGGPTTQAAGSDQSDVFGDTVGGATDENSSIATSQPQADIESLNIPQCRSS